MYNKIMNLKTKLAYYNNNSSMSQRNVGMSQEGEVSRQSLSKTFIDSNAPQSSTNVNSSILSTNTNNSQNVNNRSFLSTINSLKRKWNDVSSRSGRPNANISPNMTAKNNLNNSNTLSDLGTDSTCSINNKLTEIKNKYNMSKNKATVKK
jgi:hypothetical protein